MKETIGVIAITSKDECSHFDSTFRGPPTARLGDPAPDAPLPMQKWPRSVGVATQVLHLWAYNERMLVIPIRTRLVSPTSAALYAHERLITRGNLGCSRASLPISRASNT